MVGSVEEHFDHSVPAMWGRKKFIPSPCRREHGINFWLEFASRTGTKLSFYSNQSILDERIKF